MSKILKAYKKQMASGSPSVSQTGAIGIKSLFPAPKEAQKNDFNQLANRILGLKTGHQALTISFTATTSGEGTSFVSFNAAVNLAQIYNQKVAWIDCNFLSPVHELNNDSGLKFSSILEDPQLASELEPKSFPFLIGGGADLHSKKGLFAGPGYRNALKELGLKFDFIFLDLPPVLQVGDTALIASKCDGALLVIEQKYLKWEVVNHGVEVLQDKGVQVLGSVINRREFVLPKAIYDRL
jgi:Mrp family chromosome partitioning ATPase